MGNCLMRTSKVSSQDHDDDENYEAKVEHLKASSSSSLSKLEAPMMKEQSMKKIKKVRFKTLKGIDEGDKGNHSDSRNGSNSVRIRVVMTQEELKRIFSCNNNNNDGDDDSKNNTNNTLEQLLSAVKMRGGRVFEVAEFDDDGGIGSSWRPALESIPEDSLIY